MSTVTVATPDAPLAATGDKGVFTTDLSDALVAGEERFSEALRALDEERATDDPLNGLILSAGLTWRDVEVLRALRNHLLQIRTHYNVETVNGVLLRNSAVVTALHRAQHQLRTAVGLCQNPPPEPPS